MKSQFTTRSIKQLLADWQTAVANTPHLQPPPYHGPDVAIQMFTEKTSEVQPGSSFVARLRTGSDGHPWIGKAIELGATFILAQKSPQELGLTIPENVVYWQVPNTAETLAWLSAAWYGFPSQQLVMVGVTGTNGKTSTADLTYGILRAAGLRTGMVSTLKAIIGDREEALELHVSTPEAPVVQRYLRQMVDAGMTHCILETTSHGLAQHRVTAVSFDIAVITNITHEHLDYHGSFEEYAQAKERLFRNVAHNDATPHKPAQVIKTAILNLDDSSYTRLAAIAALRQISYSLHNPAADLHVTELVTDPSGSSFTLHLGDEALPVRSPLLGIFNVANILAAAGAGLALGIAPEVIQKGLQAVGQIHGRMHQIQRGQKFIVHVDFAHTPDGLEKAIQAARGILRQMGRNGRIITVFGSAGKRDPEKRRMMAEISTQLADLTILTAEDPRTESLDDILAAMAAGCAAQGGVEGQTYWRIPDRGQAIHFALHLARPEDFVLVAGKGHEQSMCFITTEYPWDDIHATEAALDAFLAGEPMPDLGLPTFDHDFKLTIGA
ncbi:MAG: UDP-N-acetylmuramoyl-L-alanyl-D-glutamate--2,6-diaminopimelate ligase [Ardenticatenaceae bacterium]|nr:UDP-N-acetylmuramoyl-L-alanyl-D-glutamate--2,6-diaminopimelate ligase [Anaerolineales bacterium]MCB8941963.1 UDP-N-acetylmuramoyl-L-alanyl-D-glutamate--2,6-diaminopimelate ligase [Ardenticatenaceae bacterium]MCB8973076.1 UDP-N-acetylmuramoyl-L-alanyl-D-glutamate--2,6-diaminopimelate ligase [Ardenticatenaceae bacterium]